MTATSNAPSDLARVLRLLRTHYGLARRMDSPVGAAVSAVLSTAHTWGQLFREVST